jgi:hypothetical protein
MLAKYGCGYIMEQPITLYLELEEGEPADLEVVARASIAFAQVIRETAYIIDPSIDVRIGFASGTEGSLSLNSIIKAIGKKVRDPATLRAIFMAVLLYFARELRDYNIHKAIESALGREEKLSQEDIDRIADAVARANKNKDADKHARQVYRELEADKTIKGVAVTDRPGRPPPENIVPRSEFLARSNVQVVPTDPKKRTSTTRERVTLISPVLLDQTRSWKFWLPQIGQFGARVEDQKFIRSLVSGRRKIPMRGGIQMDVVLVTHEVNEVGVWEVNERVVKEVLRVLRMPATLDLFAGAPHPEEDDE